MKIVIPTIYREKENYLVQTLEDCIQKDSTCLENEFEIFIGNRSSIGLIEKSIEETTFGEQASWSIKPLTTFEWSLVESERVHKKFNMNFMRYLTSSNFGDDLLYIEDDIKFSNKWYTKLKSYIEILDKEYNENYILSLYAPWKFHHTKLVDQIPSGHYYGTQAVFIKNKYQRSLFDKVLKDGIINYRHMADILIDEYAKENNIPILALTTSLVQHLGKVSTGLGSFHWTENFKE